MQLHGLLHTFPREIKLFLGAFVIVLSIGYFTGLLFVGQTSSTSPQGIQENYLGNDDSDNEVAEMKFKKGKREMLTIIHTHILSMSFIFMFLGSLLSMTSINKRLKTFLMVEPFVSIVVTFGGIYLMWRGIHWFKYVVMVSGVLMTLCYILGACTILLQLSKTSKNSL